MSIHSSAAKTKADVEKSECCLVWVDACTHANSNAVVARRTRDAFWGEPLTDNRAERCVTSAFLKFRPIHKMIRIMS